MWHRAYDARRQIQRRTKGPQPLCNLIKGWTRRPVSRIYKHVQRPQGFDIYNMVPGLTWNAQTDESVTSPRSIEEIIKLLSDEKNTKGQFFLWSHLMDPHDVYVRHEESPDFGKDNRGRYDSEVWFTDMWIGKLFEFGQKQLEKEGEIKYYSFNPRMLPDEIEDSKPVYRKLNKRTDEELKKIE